MSQNRLDWPVASQNTSKLPQNRFTHDDPEVIQRILPVFAAILEDLCAINDQKPPGKHRATRFHAQATPPISIIDYLSRIGKYSECSSTCFVLAMVYLDRIQIADSALSVDSLNVHRLLVVSVMLAAKFFDDHYFNNAFWAKVGGISNSELNALEIQFLYLIGFQLSVTEDVYDKYEEELTMKVKETTRTRTRTRTRTHDLDLTYKQSAPPARPAPTPPVDPVGSRFPGHSHNAAAAIGDRGLRGIAPSPRVPFAVSCSTESARETVRPYATMGTANASSLAFGHFHASTMPVTTAAAPYLPQSRFWSESTSHTHSHSHSTHHTRQPQRAHFPVFGQSASSVTPYAHSGTFGF